MDTFSPASINGSWYEQYEFRAIDDGQLADLADMTEIELTLRDLSSRLDELVLRKSTGEITIVGVGVIEWRVPQTTMAQLEPKLYRILIRATDPDGIVIVAENSVISIVE